MNFQKLQPSKHFIFSLLIAVGIGVLTSAIYVFATDWTKPPATPPTCPASEPACNTPLNVSDYNQKKTGKLSVGALGVPGAFHAWGGAIGTNDGLTVNNGKVGIGTTNPGATLEVNGNVKLSGAEPVYRIKNVKTPQDSSDVSTKKYVDDQVATAKPSGWQCQSFSKSGTKGLFDVIAYATCPIGWTMMSGGCIYTMTKNVTLLENYPSGNVMWVCRIMSSKENDAIGVEGSVLCCK